MISACYYVYLNFPPFLKKLIDFLQGGYRFVIVKKRTKCIFFLNPEIFINGRNVKNGKGVRTSDEDGWKNYFLKILTPDI